jgi:hypothetical protein
VHGSCRATRRDSQIAATEQGRRGTDSERERSPVDPVRRQRCPHPRQARTAPNSVHPCRAGGLCRPTCRIITVAAVAGAGRPTAAALGFGNTWRNSGSERAGGPGATACGAAVIRFASSLLGGFAASRPIRWPRHRPLRTRRRMRRRRRASQPHRRCATGSPSG